MPYAPSPWFLSFVGGVGCFRHFPVERSLFQEGLVMRVPRLP